MLTKWIRCSVVALALGSGIGTAMPVAAALPPLSCGQYEGLYWCVANMDNYQFAGVGSPNGLNAPDTFKVELIFYAFGSRQGFVVARSGPIRIMDSGQSIQTTHEIHWDPGVYCARVYYPRDGYWRDQHCVDTNGAVAFDYKQSGHGQKDQ
jgi:hypothetical protein